jgi:hypothetical protein
MNKPRRVYSDGKYDPFWANKIKEYNAVVLKNGENPSDYPDRAVAFETRNFGWIMSAPQGLRRILLQY